MMQKWEYKRIPMRDEDETFDEKRLNKLGQKGWELVAIADNFIINFQGGPIYFGTAFFKRPADEAARIRLEFEKSYTWIPDKGWQKIEDEGS